VIEELHAAGFKARDYQGFPLMTMPKAQADVLRLLKFRTSVAADRRIYAEGMLFVPPGAWAAYGGDDGDRDAGPTIVAGDPRA
jgi:hypothetical protein